MSDTMTPVKASASAWDEFRRYWHVLLGSMLGVAFGAAALPFYTAGLFLVHFESDFGWSRSSITLIGLINTAIVATMSPILGAAMDRHGIRWFAALSFLALALGYVANTLIAGQLWLFAVVHFVQTAVAPGSSPVAFTRPVNMVFDKMRGLALGITICGIGAAAALGPPVVSVLIESYGWRWAFRFMAVAVLVMGPIAIMLTTMRSTTFPGAARATGPVAALPTRDPVFWRLVVIFLLTSLAVAGFVVHLFPMLTDGGMPRATAAQYAGALGASVLAGRVLVGFCLDRVFAPHLAAVLFLLSAVGLALLALGGPSFALVGAIGIGLAMGAEGDIIGYLAVRYFGMLHYGRLFGLFYAAFIVGTGVSPYMISVLSEATGSYRLPLLVSVALLVVSSLLLITAPRFPATGLVGDAKHS